MQSLTAFVAMPTPKPALLLELVHSEPGSVQYTYTRGVSLGLGLPATDAVTATANGRSYEQRVEPAAQQQPSLGEELEEFISFDDAPPAAAAAATIQVRQVMTHSCCYIA